MFLAVIVVITALFISVKVNYPIKYTSCVNKYTSEYKLDKTLVYAIIKCESSFNKNATSKVGAMGLMQIMPDTGKWVAEKLAIKNFTSQDLLDSEKNIMIGVWYFKYLLDKFNGELSLAIAAYNAGPTNVSKWLEQEEYSNDGLTLNNIPFEETKKYEKKVMNTYTMYKKIYLGI